MVSAIERSLCAFARDGFSQRRKRKMGKIELTTEIQGHWSKKYGTFAGEMRLKCMQGLKPA